MNHSRDYGDPLERAYALSRVNDVLLLGFQTPAAEAAGSYAHHVIDQLKWPAVRTRSRRSSRRAGVRVRAGRHQAVARVADRSDLNEVYLRRYRGTRDLSLESGPNSQWSTDFRRDYRTPVADHLNVDGDGAVER